MSGFFEDFHALCICKAHEIVVHDKTQTVFKVLVIHFSKEGDVVLAMVESIGDTVFDELLGKCHIVVDVVKRHFRLNHPEFGKVTRSV